MKTSHTWIGLVAGAVISIIALAASATVFRNEIERASFPHTAATRATVSLDAAALQVKQFRPESHIRRVLLPDHAGAPYVFQIESGSKQTERVISDASSGRVIGTIQSGWVDWMVDLHRNLLSGKPGRAIVGAFGIILFILSLSGIWMWLAGARNWRAWITTPKPTSTVRFNYELHRLGGLWACIFLAVISFTGIGLAFPDTFQRTVQLLGGGSRVTPPKKIKGKALGSLDKYLQAGQAAMPDAVVTEMRLPESGSGPIEIRLYRTGDLAPAGNRVYLDPSTAAAITIDRLVDRPFGARFLAALSPIHYGEFGGLPIKALWSLVALCPVLLFATGVMVWWQRRSRKRTVMAPKEAAAMPVAAGARN